MNGFIAVKGCEKWPRFKRKGRKLKILFINSYASETRSRHLYKKRAEVSCVIKFLYKFVQVIIQTCMK